jgi:hypothetical protein
VRKWLRDLTAVIADIEFLLRLRLIALLVNEVLPNTEVLFDISSLFVFSWFKRIVGGSVHFVLRFLNHVVVQLLWFYLSCGLNLFE